MGVLVNAAISALAGVVGLVLTATFVSSKLSFLGGILLALIGFFGAQNLTPKDDSSVIDEWEQRQARKEQRKVKRAEKAKKEKEDERRRQEEEAAAKAAEKAKKAAKKQQQKKQPEPEPEPESESEEEPDYSKMSKGQIKKAKAAAKAKAEAKAAAAAAVAEQSKSASALKKEKEKAKAKAKAEAEKAAKAEAKLKAQMAADNEGWNTIEAKPKKNADAEQQQASSNKKVPPSERPLTIDVIIPVKQHSIIIGAKGQTLQQIQTATGATIDMPKRESGSAKINITGSPAQVAAAKNAIESLVERGFSSVTHPGILSDDLNIDPKLVGVVLGKNAQTLKTIQSKTNTRINLPDKGTTAKTAKITIVGQKEDVRAAKAALKQLIQDGFSPLTHDGWVKVEIDFPKEKLGFLIGPKGQTLKSIQGNTKTRINIPDKTSTSPSIVSVVGLPAGVAQAEKEILRLLEPPAPLPEPEEEDLANEHAWGREHTAQGEDALW